jgi:hypothetical protein
MKRDTCLNLLLPKALEGRVIDHLLGHPEWIGPFVAHPADGHGAPEQIASDAERVRGRAARVKIEILLAHGHVDDLLNDLRADLPSADIAWWLSPILDSGTLA